MLTNACKYAIRAILYLALNSDETHKIGAKKIAKELQIPQPFLAQILRTLTTNQLVSSSKGPGGGFFMDDKNKKKSLWDIICCIDGSNRFNECFLGLTQCNDINPCPAHYIVSPFKNLILNDFREKSIFQLVDEIEQKGTVISLKGFDLDGPPL